MAVAASRRWGSTSVRACSGAERLACIETLTAATTRPERSTAAETRYLRDPIGGFTSS